MADRLDNPEDPFADPATALESLRTPNRQSDPPTIETSGLSEYNPFESEYNSLDGQISSQHGLPPPYSAFEAQRASEELERRQKILDAKAAELARREEEYRLAAQTHGVEQSGTKNWPPLPSFLPCKPCFYQDIESEITPGYQKLVKIGYYLWLSYAALLCVNLFGALLYFIGTDRLDGGSLFGVAILVCILCIPGSFVCWFRPLYKAFKSNSSINFFIFFFVFAAQILVLIIQSLGIMNWGSCGWITGLAAVKGNPAIGGITLSIACLFTGLTVACAFYLIRVHHIYRNTGASFGKAREEFTRGVISDPTVRATAVEASLYATRRTPAGSS